MSVDPHWVEQHISNELGLTERDLTRLYGLAHGELYDYLLTLADDSAEVYQRVLSDIDAVRVGYRQVRVNDEHIEKLRALLSVYPFHPPVGVSLWDGRDGWRLSADDAQYVAFRAADIVGLDFEAGDQLRLRLNTLVIWQADTPPTFGSAFQDRLVDITLYLIELSGVL